MVKNFIFLFIFSTSFFNVSAQHALEIIESMFERTKKISTLKYKMNKLERIDGQMVKQQSFTKVQRNPYKVYVRQLYPKEGVEVLFVENTNDGQLLINPNGFPWVNINMDPHSSLVRKDQHHTIFNAGFDHLINVLEFLFDKYGEEVASMISLKDTVMWNSRLCYVITLNNKNFQFIDYKVKEGENLDTLAKKFMITQHMIMENNPDIDDVNDIAMGQTIKIPNSYSPAMELYIDTRELIPLVMKVYDDKGLFEHYEYLEVEINPVIYDVEFNEDYEDYGF